MRAVGAASAMELVRATDRDGWTPLHFAASNGDAALVARLVGLGADVHATDHMRRMPLHMAAKVREGVWGGGVGDCAWVLWCGLLPACVIIYQSRRHSHRVTATLSLITRRLHSSPAA